MRSLARVYRRAYSGLPRAVWLLSAALLINRLGTMVVPFLALYLTEHMGFDERSAAAVMSIYGLGSIAGAILGGRLVGAWGSIPTQIVLLFVAVPICLIVPLMDGWWPIAITAFLLSAAADGVRPASATAIAEQSDRAGRSRAFGLHRMAANLGTSVGPAIGGLLSTLSFVWLFVFDATSTFLCGLVLLAWWRRGWFTRAEEVEQTDGSKRVRGSEAAPAVSPLRNARFVIFLALNLATATIFFQFLSIYPLYLRDHFQMTRPQIGLLYAVNTGTIVLFEMVLIAAVTRYSPIIIMAFGALLSCLGYGMLPWGNQIWYAVVAMLVLTVGEMLWMPMAASWVSARHSNRQQGAAMGWYMMTYSVAFVLSPLLFGNLYQADHSYPWHLSAVMGGLLLAGFLLLKDPAEEELPDPELSSELATT